MCENTIPHIVVWFEALFLSVVLRKVFFPLKIYLEYRLGQNCPKNSLYNQYQKFASTVIDLRNSISSLVRENFLVIHKARQIKEKSMTKSIQASLTAIKQYTGL